MKYEDNIKIRGLTVFAKHGVYPEENKLGQKFVINAVLFTSPAGQGSIGPYLSAVREAGRTDDLEKSVNYGSVCEEITAFLTSHVFRLIETAAERLARHLLLTFPLLRGIRLEIEKPWAPVGLPLDSVSVEIERRWHTAYIGLGSNIGDSRGYLDQAVRGLGAAEGCVVTKTAPYIVTPPYGGVEQDDFLNSVLEMQTLLSPLELLDTLHILENEAQRTREIHWGPRTLDLDILLYDDEILDYGDFHVPHIDMQNRQFVLQPLCELAPHLIHPVLGKTMQQLLSELSEKQQDIP